MCHNILSYIILWLYLTLLSIGIWTIKSHFKLYHYYLMKREWILLFFVLNNLRVRDKGLTLSKWRINFKFKSMFLLTTAVLSSYKWINRNKLSSKSVLACLFMSYPKWWRKSEERVQWVWHFGACLACAWPGFDPWHPILPPELTKFVAYVQSQEWELIPAECGSIQEKTKQMLGSSIDRLKCRSKFLLTEQI